MTFEDFPAAPSEGVDANMIPTGDWFVDIVTGRVTLPDPGPNGADM
jgi:hypothetical protein